MSKEIYIKNKRENVIILKTLGMPDLRLFPGHNLFKGSKEDLFLYISGNKAAEANMKLNLRILQNDEEIDYEGAKAAFEKNGNMNDSMQSYRAAQEIILKKAEEKTDASKVEVKELKAENSALLERLEKMEEKMAQWDLEDETIEEEKPKKGKKGKK